MSAGYKTFFVSPEESGQICMLACVLGKSGDIFFPKLNVDQLTYFKDITESFFRESGRKIKVCHSDEQAIIEAAKIEENSPYPVHYFNTNTSGEKLYEEFFTDTDIVENNLFQSLGVIKNSRKISIEEIEITLKSLKESLDDDASDKNSIVADLKDFLPGFKHIETGKSLDQKM